MNLKHLLQIISPLGLLCFSVLSLSAQPTECFDFNNLEIGQEYGSNGGHFPGDSIQLLFNSDVITTLEPFTYANGGDPGFWNASVVDWQFGNWDGAAPYLFISNINIVYDFTHLPDVVSQVSFDFADGGGEHNIRVNGDTLYNVFEFTELPVQIAADVRLSIENNRLYLNGNIRELLIGGQELGFDNFCYVVNDVPPMCIDNIVARPQPCTPNGIFYTEISFDNYNPASDSFYIRGNGQNYGQFAYGQASYKVGPIDANPNTQYEFVIVDAADPNCSNFTEIGSVSCNTVDCNIQELWAQTTGCQTNGGQGLYFGFRQTPIDTNGFIVQIDGGFQTFFRYDPIADSIGYFLSDLNLSTGEHELTICSESNLNCCTTIRFYAPNCNNDCRVFDIETVVSECKPNGLVDVVLDFRHESLNGDFFTLLLNGRSLDTFRLSQLPLNLENLNLYPDSNILSICVYQSTTIDTDDNFECCTTIVLEAPICDTTNCKIFDLTSVTSGCNANNLIDLFIEFDHQNANTAGFDALIDGQFYDFLPFSAGGGYTFPNLALTAGEHILTICGNDQPNCCQSTAFSVPECFPMCRVFDIKTEVSECKSNNLHDLFIDFEYESLTTDFFELLIEGKYIDTFSLEHLPLTIENVDLQTERSFIEICVFQPSTPLTTDVISCCVQQEIQVPSCPNDDCRVYNFQKEDISCNEDGTYNISFSFDYDSIDLELVTILVGEENYPFEQLPSGLFQISNVGTSEGPNRLTICYKDDFIDCCISINFYALGCDNLEECKFFFVGAEAHPCDSTGYAWVDLTFNIENPTSSRFEILGNGRSYGVFEYGQGNYRIGPVKGDGITEYEFIVQDLENPACNAFTSIPPVNCEINNHCLFTSLRKHEIYCQSDGSYDLVFGLTYDENIDLDLASLKVLVDGEAYEFNKLGSDLFQIKNIGTTVGEHRLTVCYNDQILDCCISSNFYAPDCEEEVECRINNLRAIPLGCDSTGQFWVVIDFGGENVTAADSFKFSVNGEFYGILGRLNPVFHLGPFLADGITPYEFVVQDINIPSCRGFVSIPPVNCISGNSCQIDDLQTSVSDCATDGTIDIEVDFTTPNTSENGFNVFIDEQYIETYGYHQLPFVLSKVDLAAGEHTLSICPNDQDDCCTTTKIFIPSCGTCAITNVAANIMDCVDEDYFFVDLAFEVNNPTAEKFRVVGNSQLYGIFEYGQDSYQLGPLEGDGTTIYEFIVQDLQNASCASFAELENTIDCEQGFVWPGDTNFDNITDNSDVLNIGLAFGQTGPSRTFNNADSADIAAGLEIAWEAKEALDWDFSFSNGLNAKHADCNGDGVIDEEDLKAIEENYFFTHGEVKPRTFSESTSNAPSLYVDFPALTDIELGSETKVPIIFGSENIPATAYGLAFTLSFDPRLIKNARIEFIDSWLGLPEQDLLTINKNFAADGIIEIALSRKAGSTPIGAGGIGNFIVIIDDIEGYTGNQPIEIQKVQAIDNEGNLLAVHTPKTILSSITDTENPDKEDEIDITVYPNPASDVMTIHYPIERDIKQVDIRSISGRLIQSIAPNNLSTIDISTITKGVYILEIQMGETTVYRKLVKQ